MSTSNDKAMTPAAASRIQSHADRTGATPGFKARAQASAAKAGATLVTGIVPNTASKK